MADQYFNAAVHGNLDGQQDAKDRVTSACEEMVVQMNSFSSNHNYHDYDYDNHSWVSWANYVCCGGSSSEQSYLDNVVDSIENAAINGNIIVAQGDCWIVADAFESYGYGAYSTSNPHTISDGFGGQVDIWVARVLDVNETGSNDPNRIETSFYLHEAAHTFGAKHKHGAYSLNANDEIRDVSPMATGYVRHETPRGTEPDTCFAGSGHTPDPEFICDHDPNFTSNPFCAACSDWCRHRFGMTAACSNQDAMSTKEIVESNTPLGA